MLGARTNRYGDLIDLCAALTGLVPRSGLHVRRNRAARAVFTVDTRADPLRERVNVHTLRPARRG